MSSLVSSLTSDLVLSTSADFSDSKSERERTRSTPTETEESLSQILLQVNKSLPLSSITSHLEALHHVRRERSFSDSHDEESSKLEQAVSAKIAVRLYEETLNILLNEALEVEHELRWWNDVESGRSTRVALYLLQSTLFI